MTGTARFQPAELANLTLEQIADRYTARFADRKANWDAFEDSRVEGHRRAQHRLIAAARSSIPGDGAVIPPHSFTLSVLYVPPGQGNAAHTHPVEEVLFVLQGYLTAFLEDEDGRRVAVKLGPWDCMSCPPGIFHGYVNEGLEPVYVMAMVGRAQPDRPGYTEPERVERGDSRPQAAPS